MNNYLAIEIKPNVKGTVQEFFQTFKPKYLESYGFKCYKLIPPLPDGKFNLFTVKTVHGEMVVHSNDTLIYKGHNSWEVRK